MRAALAASWVSAAHALDFASMWSEFKSAHGKVYGNATEEERRFAIFATNADFVQAENAKGHDFELELNQFADLAPEEFAATHMSSRLDDETLQGESVQLGQHQWQGEELADSVDWVERGAVTPVKNQQTCGSCWAFSAVGALEGAAQLARGPLQEFSEQNLVDCAGDYGNLGCQGGMMDFAFEYVKKGGICTGESYPYTASDGNDCKASSCERGLEADEVTGYVDVGHREQDLMAALAQQPVSVAIQANLPFFQFYKKGVFGGVCGGMLDHGVLAVGYGTWENGKEYWKVRNSWGSSWGQDGYILLKRGRAPWKRTGQCGILKVASYPQVSSSSSFVV